MNNRKLGNDFETAFCEILFENGFWVHNLAQNQAGQPADVIAARNGRAYLIDCKVCSNRGFALSRIEENQDLSMDLWGKCGNGEGWFALLFEEQVYMIQHYEMLMFEEQCTNIGGDVIRQFGVPLEEWMVMRQ